MADFGDNILGGFGAGVSLAQHIQQVQAQRADIEEKKKQQAIAKSNYFVGKLKDGMLLPSKVQGPYFKNLQAQMEQMDYPVDPSFIAVAQDKENRTAMLSSLNHFLNLPDDEKAQKGEQVAAWASGDTSSFAKFLMSVKEAQSSAGAQLAKQQQTQNTNEFKQANLSDKVVREVSNYGPIKTQEQNILNGQSALSNIEKDPNHVLFRDYKEAIIEMNKILTGSSVLPIAREEGLEFKSRVTAGQQFIDRFKGSESDFIDPNEAKVTIDRLSRLINKAKTGRDTLYKKQIDARVQTGVISREMGDGLFAQLAHAQEAPVANDNGLSKYISALTPQQVDFFKGKGLTPGSPEFAKAFYDKHAKANPTPAAASAPAATPTPEAGTGAGALDVSPVADGGDSSGDTPSPTDSSGADMSVEPVGEGDTQ